MNLYSVIELRDPIPSPNPSNKVRSNCFQAADGFEIVRIGDYYYVSHQKGVGVVEVHASGSRRAVVLQLDTKAVKVVAKA